MTREEIEALTNLAVDDLLAEKVMGWRFKGDGKHWTNSAGLPERRICTCCLDGWNPSRNIIHAMEAVQKLGIVHGGFGFELYYDVDAWENRWVAGWMMPQIGFAKTAERAICNAVLLLALKGD
jgi:hypothetical protein